jgi:L-lactate dehydrogenase (cytochrome)
VAATRPEEVGPGDGEVRRDLLRRAREAGSHTLILTVDVPVASRSERLKRARLSNPMRMTPRAVLDATRPPG